MEDLPRANRYPGFVASKVARLYEPHVAPLSRFVERLRASHPTYSIPWFDPDDAGVGASILTLLEAPGPAATGAEGPRASVGGSGFISANNIDSSAATMWQLFREAEIVRRRDHIAWNVVPWYVGDESRIRGVVRHDTEEARSALYELLELLPSLRIVVLIGAKALDAWARAQIPFPVVAAPHPSPRNLASRPSDRGIILNALIIAKREAAARPPYRPAS